MTESAYILFPLPPPSLSSLYPASAPIFPWLMVFPSLFPFSVVLSLIVHLFSPPSKTSPGIVILSFELFCFWSSFLLSSAFFAFPPVLPVLHRCLRRLGVFRLLLFFYITRLSVGFHALSTFSCPLILIPPAGPAVLGQKAPLPCFFLSLFLHCSF